MRALVICPLLAVLGSCTSPPKPPTVDPTTRRPVNIASEVDLQACKGELQNTRILASETKRVAENAATKAVRLAQQQIGAACSAGADAAGAIPVYTVLFAFGSTELNVAPSAAPTLIE